MPEPSYLYAIVRRDLSLAQRTVQAMHAVIEHYRRLDPKTPEHPHLVVCGVRDLAALLRAVTHLESFIPTLYCEPDRDDEPTALCVGPLTGPARQALRRYQLLGE